MRSEAAIKECDGEGVGERVDGKVDSVDGSVSKKQLAPALSAALSSAGARQDVEPSPQAPENQAQLSTQ